MEWVPCEVPIVCTLVHHNNLWIAKWFCGHHTSSFHIGLAHEKEDFNPIQSSGQYGDISLFQW
jgi:hypothetical protein